MERSKTLLYLPNGSSDQRPVNNLIAHEQIEKSVHLVQLTHDLGESDQILFSRGLMPRDWLPADEHTGCMEARIWESNKFGEFCDQNMCVASDGSGGSKETPNA